MYTNFELRTIRFRMKRGPGIFLLKPETGLHLRRINDLEKEGKVILEGFGEFGCQATTKEIKTITIT